MIKKSFPGEHSSHRPDVFIGTVANIRIIGGSLGGFSRDFYIFN